MLTQDAGKALLGQGSQQKAPSKSNLNVQPTSILEPYQSKQHKKSKNKKQDKNQTQFTSILKIFNIIIGAIVVGFGIICYTIFQGDTPKSNFVGFILPGYIALSGIIILLIQCNIGFIIKNMRFLYNYFGRGLFNIYVGVMPLCLISDNPDDNQSQTFQIMIIVMVSLMCLIGVLYILSKIFCCAKEEANRKKRRKHSSSDSSDSD